MRYTLKTFFLLLGLSSFSMAQWSQQAKLVSDDGATKDQFGRSVSVDGDYAIVGANYDDGHSGSAYIFIRSGTSWSHYNKLVAEDAAGGDEFGISVAISGDYVIAGAHYDDDGGYRTGSAYIYQIITMNVKFI